MTSRRATALICAALSFVMLHRAPVGARPERFTLATGQSLFWNGPHVGSSDEGGRCNGDPCWTYELDVARGYRLRIGIDHPEVGDVYTVEVEPPQGSSFRFSPGAGLYSEEAVREDPEPGIWRVTVIATDVTDSAFRMRARLEREEPSLGTKNGPVLPNLQVLPPHEASFLVPLTNGSTDGEPQSADASGAGSCHLEEYVEDGAVRCLRFAFGVRNTGRGPLQLYYEGGIPNDHELFQRVQRGDDSYFDRPAGVARFHKTHGHYHHHDAVGLQLFAVTDRKKGALEPAGERRNKGFAHRNELLRDWNTFYPIWSDFGFGLRAGWSDIYEWDRPGNYIDFGLNGDGYYVIRMWADPVDGILESNERDNAGYTYLKVTGSDVKLLEAGRGKDPWDPCRIVVGFGGHPDPEPRSRPSTCPPDTT